MVKCPHCGNMICEMGPRISCSSAVYDRCGSIAKRQTEAFYVFALDQKHNIKHRYQIACGSLTEVGIHPRDVFTPLVRCRAAKMIIVHNHPSGDFSPSDEDIQLTERLVEVGKLLGIPVLDHLIVTKHGYYSFCDKGRI